MYARTGNNVSVPRFLKTIWIDSPERDDAPMPSKSAEIFSKLVGEKSLREVLRFALSEALAVARRPQRVLLVHHQFALLDLLLRVLFRPPK